MSDVICPHCDSPYVNKAGQKNGKQRYLCKACSKKFTHGEYIKQEKNKTNKEKKKNFQDRFKPIQKKNKIFNFEELVINEVPYQKTINNTKSIKLNLEILKIVDEDLRNNTISLDKYKNIIENLTSDEENELARRLSNVKFQQIESCMKKRLFQNHHNEKLDALIIKILIESGEDGIKILMEYINNSRQYKMTKYNLNVIGKHMSQKLSISWKIIKRYIRNGISNNCAYTITRYINYVAGLSYRELRKDLSFEEIRSMFFNRSIDSIFSITKISDSGYMDNLSEFHYSLNKILIKMSKKELVNYDYLEQYNNSIFTENNIENCLRNANTCIKRIKEYDELEKMNDKDISETPWIYESAFPILSKKGIKIIGEKISSFYKEYCSMEFTCKQYEFNMWLDKYTNYIYKTLLKYGIEEFKTFFRYDWGEEFIFRCKISSKETEILAEKICEEYFKNPRKDYPQILDNVFHNLLYALNEKAIDTLIYMIDHEIITEEDYLFYQNVSFHFILGVTEQIYGDFYNIKKDFLYRRSHKGLEWERIVGYILNEKYEDIGYHPILDNNKIPDYALIKGENLEKIIECKLILGFEEFKETILKYNSYCDLIEFYCLRNDIKENIINSKDYNEVMKKTSKNFRYEIKDFNDIYKMTNKYKEALSYFEKNVKSVTQKNLLKEKICLNFKDIKKDKILYLFDYTFSKSKLF